MKGSQTYGSRGGNADGGLLSGNGLRLAKAAKGGEGIMYCKLLRKLLEQASHLDLNGSDTFLANHDADAKGSSAPGVEFALAGSDMM